MNKRIGIIVFPGSNCDRDCRHVFSNVYNLPTRMIWHRDNFNLRDFELIMLPGGFSYGDYLRAGAIARFSLSMNSLMDFAQKGKPVLGICNGFQILCEANLLPGALVVNKDLLFKCQNTPLKGANPASEYLGNIGDNEFDLPIAHGEGSYVIDSAGYESLVNNSQIIMTYMDNPNGSYADIAGVTNKKGNVMGMMPHPERASEVRLGLNHGRLILDPLLEAI